MKVLNGKRHVKCNCGNNEWVLVSIKDEEHPDLKVGACSKCRMSIVMFDDKDQAAFSINLVMPIDSFCETDNWDNPAIIKIVEGQRCR